MGTSEKTSNFYSYLDQQSHAFGDASECAVAIDASVLDEAKMASDPANKKVEISADVQEALGKTDIANFGISVEEDKGTGKFSVLLDIEDAKVRDETAKKITDGLKNKGYEVGDPICLSGDDHLWQFEIDTGTGKGKGPAEDDIPDVLRLKNLYRSHRISKEQAIGGLATLHAAGILSGAQFTRLKNSI